MTSSFDHPIFTESIRRIKSQLGSTGLGPIEQQVLERLIHSSGDFQLAKLLFFSDGACSIGISAIKAGSLILTDTDMAAAAIKPMAKRTMQSEVRSILEWAPEESPRNSTRTSEGLKYAWRELYKENSERPSPIVVIGSAPKALLLLLELVSKGAIAPSLIIGMPVGFVGVAESKYQLSSSSIPYIKLEGSRGGAGLAAATINALLRAAKNGY